MQFRLGSVLRSADLRLSFPPVLQSSSTQGQPSERCRGRERRHYGTGRQGNAQQPRPSVSLSKMRRGNRAWWRAFHVAPSIRGSHHICCRQAPLILHSSQSSTWDGELPRANQDALAAFSTQETLWTCWIQWGCSSPVSWQENCMTTGRRATRLLADVEGDVCT